MPYPGAFPIILYSARHGQIARGGRPPMDGTADHEVLPRGLLRLEITAQSTLLAQVESMGLSTSVGHAVHGHGYHSIGMYTGAIDLVPVGTIPTILCGMSGDDLYARRYFWNHEPASGNCLCYDATNLHHWLSIAGGHWDHAMVVGCRGGLDSHIAPVVGRTTTTTV